MKSFALLAASATVLALSQIGLSAASPADATGGSSPSAMHPQQQPGQRSKDRPQKKKRVYHLGSMTVTAHSSKIELLCAFRSMFLTDFSPDPAKRDQIICRTEQATGSHFHRLWCITNGEYYRIKHADSLKGQPPTFVVHGMEDAGVSPISARAVHALLVNERLATSCQSLDHD